MKYPDPIAEAQARQRKAAVRILFVIVRIIAGSIIGFEWLINWNNYIDSWRYEGDLEVYLEQYISIDTSHCLASIIQHVSPWLCIVALYQPLHFYLKYIGWYCHSSNSDTKAKTVDGKPL